MSAENRMLESAARAALNPQIQAGPPQAIQQMQQAQMAFQQMASSGAQLNGIAAVCREKIITRKQAYMWIITGVGPTKEEEFVDQDA